MYHSDNKRDFVNDDIFSIENEYKSEKPNIIKWVYLFYNKWYWFIGFIILGLLSAYIVNRYTPLVYKVDATVLIKSEVQGNVSEEMAMMSGFSTPDMQNFQNQTIILKSESLIIHALEQLDFNVSYYSKGKLKETQSNYLKIYQAINQALFSKENYREEELYLDQPFQVILDKTHVQPIGVKFYLERSINGDLNLVAHGENVVLHDFFDKQDVGELSSFRMNEQVEIGKRIEGEHYAFTIKSDKSNLDEALSENNIFFLIRDNKRIINDFLDIDVSFAAQGASIAYVSTTGTCLEKTKSFLNMLMTVWIQNGLDQKNQIANNTISFIDQQLYGIGDTLGRMGAKLRNFRTSNNVVMPTVQVEAAYVRLQEIDAEILELQTQTSYFKRLRGYLNKREDFNKLISPVSVGIRESVLTDYIAQLGEVRAALFQYKGKVELNNPYLERLQRQEATILASLYENINSQEEYINDQEEVLKKQKARISREQNLLPGMEQKFLNIQRNYDLTNDLYTLLLERRVEAQIQKASNLPNSEIIEPATFKAILQPVTMLIFIIGGFIGFMIPGLFFFLSDFFNTKVQTEEDLERITTAPIIGRIAFSKKNGDVLTQKYPGAPITEAFRSLRTRLDYLKNGSDKQTILVTSTTTGEGKSFCAVNIAGIHALAGRKTILLGFDLRKPQLGEYLGISEEAGITTFLNGENTLEEVIHHSKYKNLDCIVAGPIPLNPAEIVGSKVTGVLFEQLEKRYECIVIDTSPMGIVTDALLLTPYASTNIFVVRHQVTDKLFFKQNMKILSDANIHNVGLVMNGVKIQKYGHAYNYAYGYSVSDM
ncbi:polysaccharide biosynthesis tyrosine autokinase [Ancylomarina sp.]|uniref:polysaccharide biosynthesis tyrosine autokinase n=1 Tax=Ancylomarina sp. TaxID=1970196 RepID=UPI003565E439